MLTLSIPKEIHSDTDLCLDIDNKHGRGRVNMDLWPDIADRHGRWRVNGAFEEQVQPV